jgi:sulfofructose kinase
LQLSVDGGNPIPNLDLSTVELYAPSHDDGRRAKITVITRGAGGCTAFVDGDRLEVPGYPVDGVVSTLGAGDVFHGAFTLALAERQEVAAALRFAAAAAGLKCTRLGGSMAAPYRAEVEALLATG